LCVSCLAWLPSALILKISESLAPLFE